MVLLSLTPSPFLQGSLPLVAHGNLAKRYGYRLLLSGHFSTTRSLAFQLRINLLASIRPAANFHDLAPGRVS
jgi:hypothetical protein